MKKILSVILVAALVVLAALTTGAVNAKADNIKVTGTVEAGTTTSLIKLNTSGGIMEIKIDGDTDMSGCKSLLPGQSLNIDIKYGQDAFWHAVKVNEAGKSLAVTIDTSNVNTVYGIIKSVKSTDTLEIQLDKGDMLLKLDPTTDYSRLSLLMLGKTYEIKVARGSDAYMHAVSMADTNYSISTGYTAQTTTVAAPTLEATNTVTGTVGDKSNSDIIYLSTAQGEIQLKLDYLTKSYVLYRGQKITAKIGCKDGYWHAVTITY
ncbi:MAG: hypothetical protein MJ133_05320 [Lachnospiraceae bacterium]|nr:hypothetical protein [Lachnospiraceae bacterium]